MQISSLSTDDFARGDGGQHHRRRADVGTATLLRRSPTREDLITATFADKMSSYAQAIDTAPADPDPRHGFCRYLEEVCSMQPADRGFCNVLTLTFPAARSFEAEPNRAYRGFAELIRRAKAAGKLRPDFSAEDLPPC